MYKTNDLTDRSVAHLTRLFPDGQPWFPACDMTLHFR